MIDPTSHLFETLVLNNYHELLSHSTKLHQKCIQKVVRYLVDAISADSQDPKTIAKDIAMFNMFEGILEKEVDMMRILELER